MKEPDVKCAACGLTHRKKSLNVPGPTLEVFQYATEWEVQNQATGTERLKKGDR